MGYGEIAAVAGQRKDRVEAVAAGKLARLDTLLSPETFHSMHSIWLP
jgi:hypothetical protein